MRSVAVLVFFAVALGCAGCGDDNPSSADAGSDPAVDAASPPPDAGYPRAVTCGEPLSSSAAPALPRNVIVVLGDGMGPEQVRAGALAAGRELALTGLSEPVYLNTDSLTTDQSASRGEPTDSAASATALATGVRTLNGAVGVGAEGQRLTSVAALAAAEGKAVGIITTSYVHDASSAAFVAHVASRNDYDAILTEMLAEAQPQVILGGGRSAFDADDGRFFTLADERGYTQVRTADELDAYTPADGDRLLGIFESSAESRFPALYEWETTPVALRDETSTDPSLATMTRRALERLERDPEGLFLFVENEHTDTLGHIALIERELAPVALPLEVVALDEAVTEIVAWVEASSSFDETLVIVTADHETGGYFIDNDSLDSAVFTASPEHTRQPVPVYARGPGAESLARACRIADLFWLMTGRLDQAQ